MPSASWGRAGSSAAAKRRIINHKSTTSRVLTPLKNQYSSLNWPNQTAFSAGRYWKGKKRRNWKEGRGSGPLFRDTLLIRNFSEEILAHFVRETSSRCLSPHFGIQDLNTPTNQMLLLARNYYSSRYTIVLVIRWRETILQAGDIAKIFDWDSERISVAFRLFDNNYYVDFYPD